MWTIFASCGSCHLPISVVVTDRQGNTNESPGIYAGEITRGAKWGINRIYPAPTRIDAPENIPAGVNRAFIQAAESRQSGHFDAAAAMYRKSMELGLKDKSPGIDAWKIEKRIDKMAAEGLITAELQDWAHELRLDGNDAVHEDEMEKEAVDQMHDFCTFLLTYLYTLPEQVKVARARRAADA
jgi:hypothetical protein